jgi:alkylation response protein AidB-like acyl-CoA dehydrogenase
MTLEPLYSFFDQEDVRQSLHESESSGEGIAEWVVRSAAELGLFGLSISGHYGGHEEALAHRVGIHMQLGRISTGLQSILTVHEMASYAIARFGTDAQREELLPQMATGAMPGAFALSEASGGSNFAQVESVALMGDDSIVLNGSKSWVSNGQHAQIVVVFANSDSGDVALLVRRSASGIAVTPSPEMSAFRSASMAEMSFQDCALTREDLLGRPGLGMLRIGTACLSLGRILVAAGALGLATASFGTTAAQVRSRRVGTRQLSDHDVVRGALAEAFIGMETARSYVSRAASFWDVKDPSVFRSAMIAKMAACDVALNVSQIAVRFGGARALTMSSIQAKHAAEAQVYSTIEGTREALLSSIGGDVSRLSQKGLAWKA